MRLAQIARKVDVKPTEIRGFIKEKFNIELDSDPNTKLDQDQVDAILEEYKKEDETPEVIEKQEVVVEEEIEIDPNIDTDVDALKEVASQEEPVLIKADDISVKTHEQPTDIFPKADDVKTNTKDLEDEPAKKVVEIKYDDPEEEVEIETKEEEPTSFEEVEVDREAELIAAKVEKLEGLKVVGKIDLGQDEPEPEEEELPTAEAIENEIDSLDGDVDTSEFTDLDSEEMSDEKAAIFAELDAAMEKPKDSKVKTVANEAAEVTDNMGEDENSMYKNSKGEYRWTAEQKKNRADSLAIKEDRERNERIKRRKQKHYQENVATKVKQPKKKKTSKPKADKKQIKEEPKGPWKKFLNWLND